MNRTLLATAIAALAMPAVAMEMGPLSTGAESGDWQVGVHYYYGRSQWDTGSELGDEIVGDLTQKGAYLTADYTILPWLEAHAAVGGISYETTSEFPGAETSSSMDTAFSVGVSASVLDDEEVTFGPFLRFTRYSDYELTGTVVNDAPATDFEAESSDWRKLSVGLAVQHHTEPAEIYYGLYHNTHSVDVSGIYGSDDFSETLKEDRDMGLFIGAIWPINERFNISMEYDHSTDAAVALGINYRFAATRTVIQKETVYIQPPQPPRPATETRTILFRSGSTEVEQGYWQELRKFADFARTYPDTQLYIGGHCDCVGTDEDNLELSQRRGDAVKNMLVGLYGIDPDRIHVTALGERVPVAPQDERNGNVENRRVVLFAEAAANKESDSE